MTTTTEEINVRIRGQSGELSSAMRDGAASVRTNMASIRNEMERVRAVASSAFAVFAGGSIISSLVSTGAKAIQLGDDLNKAAIKANVTGEAISELAYAGKLADVDLNGLSNGLRFMQVNLSKAASGVKESVALLHALGLELKDIKGLAADRQFELIADRISKLQSAEDRTRAATEMFGRSGAQLLPMFEQGADGIRKAREEAQRLGLVIGTEQQKTLAQADDSVKRMKASWEAFATTLTAKVAPAISGVLDLLTFKTDDPSKFQGEKSTEELKAFLGRLQESESAGTLTGGEKRTMDWIKQELIRRHPRIGPRGGVEPADAPPGFQPEGDKPGKANSGMAEQLRAQQRLTDTKLDNARDLMRETQSMWDEMTKAELQSVDTRLQRGRIALDEQMQNLRRLADAGEITRKQELGGLAELEGQRFQIEADALSERIRLEQEGTLEYQRLRDEREVLELDHQSRLRQIDLDAKLEQKGRMADLFSGMRAGMQSVLAAGLNLTLSLKNFFRGLAQAVAGAMADMGAKVIATKLAELAAGKSIHLKEIAMSAKGAAAGAYKAIAGIPYVGPALAPIAAGVALGAVMKFASAAKGYDIPAGVNPMTQLHEREMVLPAKYADLLRQQADGGGAGSGGGPPIELKAKRIGRGEMMVRERDLVSVLRRLGMQNYRPGLI